MNNNNLCIEFENSIAQTSKKISAKNKRGYENRMSPKIERKIICQLLQKVSDQTSFLSVSIKVAQQFLNFENVDPTVSYKLFLKQISVVCGLK